MKNLTLSIFFAFWSLVAMAQTDSIKLEKPAGVDRNIGRNEIKLNFLLAFIGTFGRQMELYYPEITYERKIDNGIAMGISAWRMANEDLDYIFTPHFRVYSEKKNNGFFVEFNMALLKAAYNYRLHGHMPITFDNKPGKQVGRGLGFAAGGKFLIGNGFVMEAYLGYGKSKVHHEGHEGVYTYPRFGITMGQRF